MVDKKEQIAICDDGTLSVHFYCSRFNTRTELRHCENKCSEYKDCGDAKAANQSMNDFMEQWINGNTARR